MAKNNGRSSIFDSPWATFARVVFTAVFFFWLYWIGISTKDLDDKINASADRYTTIDSLQIEYKDEVQAWKDLLLRSNNRDALNQSWLVYDAQSQKVAAATQDIISHNELRSLNQKMRSFLDAHTVNHEKYKNGTLVLIDSKYSPGPADTSVKGIDRPLLDILKSANEDMQDEKRRESDGLIAGARNKIEQSLFALGFIGLLAIWMPKH